MSEWGHESFEAAADLSSYQYRFVKPSSGALKCTIATTGSKNLGVLQNKPDAAGKAADVIICGLSKVYINDASLALGSLLRSDTIGAAAIAKVVGQCISGMLVDDAGTEATGDIRWAKIFQAEVADTSG